jgi:hypothetical protein
VVRFLLTHLALLAGNAGARGSLLPVAGGMTGIHLQDTIADFEPGIGRLKIPGLSEADARLFIANSTFDQNGNAMLPLTSNDALTPPRLSPMRRGRPSFCRGGRAPSSPS